jgi:hypothetical protein
MTKQLGMLVLFFALAAPASAQIVYQVAPGGVIDINPISTILPPGTTRMNVNLTTIPGTVHGTVWRFANFTYEPWGQGFPNPFTVFNSLGTGNENRIFAGQGFHYEASATATLGSIDNIPVTYTDGFTTTSGTIQITIANVYYPVITQQPTQNPQTNPGQVATLQVAASIPTPPGSGTLTYQWYSGIAPNATFPVSGATSPTFTWNVPASQGLGQYWYWCRVTLTGQGFTASQTGTVTVTNQQASVQSLQTGLTGPTNLSSIQYQLEFAATGPAVGGLSPSNFSLTTTGVTGASITSAVSALGGQAVYPTWFITVNTGSGSGTIRLNLANSTGATIGISGLPYNSGQTVTIDKTPPTAQSLTRVNTSPTNASSVQYALTMSESVTGITSARFSFTLTGTMAGTSVTNVSGSGSSYTITVNTGSGDGTLRLELDTSLGGIADAAGNVMSVGFNGEVYTLDRTPPGVSIGAPSVSSTVSGPVDFTVTYTGASSVTLVPGNVSLSTTGTATGSVGVTGSGTGSRTVTISSITGTGTIAISIASGTATDAVGNSAAAAGPSTSFSVTQPPSVVSVVRVGTTPTNAASVSWTVTLTVGVTGLSTSNFTVATTGLTGASVTGVSGTGTTYTITANTGTGDGTIRLDVDNTTGVTPAIVSLPFTTGQSYAIDKTAPSATSIVRAGANPTSAATVDFTVAFSEAVSGVTTGKFGADASGVTGAFVTGTSGTGASYTVTVNTGSGDGTLSVDLTTTAGVTDAAGNALSGTLTTGEAYTIDKSAPTVSSIVRAGGSPTNAASVDFTVTFSETVTGVTTGAFALDASGVSGAAISGVSGSGNTRTVTVNTGAGSGSLSIDLATTTGILDAASNTLAGTFTTGEAYAIDKTAPFVVSIMRAGADPVSAASVDFTVTFSESINGLVTGAFSVDSTGVSGASVTGVSGSGASFTVSVNTGSGDGTVSVDLSNVAGVTDSAGNGLSGTFTAGETYSIDKTAPGVAISAPSVSTTSAGPVDYTVTYTGAAAVTLAVGDVSLNATGTATGTIGLSGSGSSRTVTISGITGNGTLGISIAAGTATDTAGNAAAATGPSATFTASNVPSISIGAPSAGLTAGGPVDFVVDYTAATAVTLAAGDVTLNTTGTVTGSVSVTGSGTATRTVTVSAIAGDGSFTVSIAAGTASNPGGSALATGPSAGVTVDNTVPVLTPVTGPSISQGATATGVAVGSVSDNLTGAGSLAVTATNVPTGLTVTNIVNTAGSITADISVALATAVSSLQIEFTVTDAAGNDSAANFGVDVLANAAPTISAILDQSILMNADTGALAFTVGDTEDGPAALVLAATSSNQVLVVDGTDFLFGGSGASRTLTVTPQANGVGVAVITVTVTDSVSATTTVTFTLTVTDTVSAPSISAIADFTMVRDTTSDAVAFTADDPQGAATITAITFDSSDTALIPVAGIVLTGTAPSLQFTVTPTPGAIGTATITVSATDGTFTASRTFVVTVQAPGSSSGSGDSNDDDESCTTGESSGLGLLALLALLGIAAVGVRTRKA